MAAMDRRLLLSALAGWPAAGLLAQDAQPRPRHKISAASLYEALTEHFPLQHDLGGLLNLRVSAPRLLLLPVTNQIGAALLAEVSGARLGQGQAGEMDVVFSLRYEPSDRSIRAHRPQVLDLRWPGLPPEAERLLQRLMPSAAQDMGEVVLHRLTPRELALPDTMGLQPEELQVVDDGVIVFFGPKPRS